MDIDLAVTDKAIGLYTYDGTAPDVITALRSAFRAGAEFAVDLIREQVVTGRVVDVAGMTTRLGGTENEFWRAMVDFPLDADVPQYGRVCVIPAERLGGEQR